MNKLVSRVIKGHQKRCWKRFRVWTRPGWQASWDECSHWRTSERTESGTNSMFGRVSKGPATERTFSSTCQVASPTIQEWRKDGTGLRIWRVSIKLVGQSVRFYVPGGWAVGKGKVKKGEEKHPPYLPGIQLLHASGKPGSCGLATLQTGELNPAASDATSAAQAPLPATPDFSSHNWPVTDAGWKRHRDGASNPRNPTATEPHRRWHLMHLTPRWTGNCDLSETRWELR